MVCDGMRQWGAAESEGGSSLSIGLSLGLCDASLSSACFACHTIAWEKRMECQMNLRAKLWADEAGFIISAELCLVATIVVIGLIVGLVTVRNQVVQEVISVGEAVGTINTSYAICGLQTAHAGMASWTGASWWVDPIHFCHPLPGEQFPAPWEGGILVILPGTGTPGAGGQVGYGGSI